MESRAVVAIYSAQTLHLLGCKTFAWLATVLQGKQEQAAWCMHLLSSLNPSCTPVSTGFISLF